jgi:hypothetical protein
MRACALDGSRIRGSRHEMNRHHTKRSAWQRVALALVLVVAVAALAGCGGVAEHPGGPANAPTTPLAANVPAAVRTPVLAALKSAGLQFDATAVTVTYGSSRDLAIVTGALQGPSGLAMGATSTAGLVGFSEIDLTLESGKWVITGSRR